MELEDFIPHPYFLKELINYVLKGFIKKNHVKGENVGKPSPNTF